MRNRLATIAAGLVVVLVACGIPDNGQVSQLHNDLGPLDDTIPDVVDHFPTDHDRVDDHDDAGDHDDDHRHRGGHVVLHQRRHPRTVPAERCARERRRRRCSGRCKKDLRSAMSSSASQPRSPRKALAPLNVTEDGSGVATVDLPANFYDTIKQEDQVFAIGQIVLTLTELGRIGQVRFTQAGVPIGVPRGSRELSQPGEPLPPRDYQELLESVATDTTTTTVVVAATTV